MMIEEEDEKRSYYDNTHKHHKYCSCTVIKFIKIIVTPDVLQHTKWPDNEGNKRGN